MTLGSTASAEFKSLLDQRRAEKQPVDWPTMGALLAGIVDRLDEERRLHEQESKLPLAGLVEKPSAKKKPMGARKPAGDEEWLTELEADPTYAGIDIRRELGKCTMWAKQKNKPFVTRLQFINWLNKCERPIGVSGIGQTSQPRSVAGNGIPEPSGWRAWVRANATDTTHADRAWSSLDRTSQLYISEQVGGRAARQLS
jgi:hypothetical protein